jgi:transcriptional regulator with XRE-family HTH domain
MGIPFDALDARPKRPSRAERAERNRRWRLSDRMLDELVVQLVAARCRAGLTQAQVADRMRPTRSAVSRLESGAYHRPTLTTIESYALVVGCKVEVTIRPGP